MAYAILRFAKRKGGAAKAIAAHNERTKEAYASNPDIDKSRTVQNYHLIAPRWSYGQEIRHRISMAGCRVRRDSVKFVETLITTSPEFAKAHESEMPEYFERALGFLKERVGEENIFSAVVHMDEKTPHMHMLCAADEGQPAVRKRNPRKQEKHDPLAGRFLRLHGRTLAGAGARHTCHRDKAQASAAPMVQEGHGHGRQA